MKIILKENENYLLRFDPGDEVLSLFKDFCKKENINSGSFTAIGATGEIIIYYYDLDRKEYLEKILKERLEITSLIGNIAHAEDDIIIHAHGTFAGPDCHAFGGHVKKLVVSATCELSLQTFKAKVEREQNEEVGLKLLK
ncbi:MAG: DNA-binding protein [Candidatus Yanofskybacteria bacterium CG10_big_fil_rev_8_21_14_0_10_36_16]|uniref:DNA-binding protein n=1 Tax=Candidatus Yanofskybacteria bacterium CG10_big_fil_rev_8_21_14_0_10_36_16 TaxID=1975096 RepID=A0A2J0Q6K0_9BACT|nr:MAG: DNA-binding protein [Candidatus Yanofskybacteria bacterium CG10_big_fil_rev_8_21_14_0_10_36_16]